MKYVITVFVTAIIVFMGATVYYKGLPKFAKPSGVAVTSTEISATAIPTAEPSTEASVSASPDDNSSLIAAVKKGLVTRHGQDAQNLVITVSKVDGDYAKGMASEQGGGGIWFAVKENGFWTLAWDGNGIITCDDISPYPGFPTSMIPECWDTKAGKTVSR